ncbi:TPA: hypothetical protein N0F65_007153, partial [Lagenidium giganteum]
GPVANMLSTGVGYTWKEHALEEIPVCPADLGDALTCLLHTILFARAPGPVRPSEATCQAFPTITYSLCAVGDVSRKVEHTVHAFEAFVRQTLHGGSASGSGRSSGSGGGGSRGASWAGGCIVVTFFERKVKSALFGFMSSEEKLCFEKWILPFHVSPAPASVQEKETFTKETEAAVQNALLHILSLVQSIDHIPNAMYDFEISHFSSIDAMHQDATTTFSSRASLGSSGSVRLP